ncbi:MAG TPA: HDIG domain-containing protein [Thermoanaerobaculia bacterium]|nr:HDIG domain-containing protein [Thermoanaerobaculia bacterium]
MARDRETTGVIEIRPATRAMLLRRRLRLRDAWETVLEKPWLWLGVFLVLATWALTPGVFFFHHRAQEGEIADRDYTASRDLLINDDEATQAKQKEARDAVLPVYDLDSTLRAERDAALAQFFDAGRKLLAGGQKEAAARAEAVRQLTASPPAPDGVKVAPEEAQVLAAHGFSSGLEDRARGALGQALRRGVVANKDQLLENRLHGITLRNLETGGESVKLDLFDHLGYPGEARDFFESEVRGWSGFNGDERRLLVDFLAENLPPNLSPNRSETLRRQAGATSAVSQVFNLVRKGQVIVRKGDVIHAGEARTISQMRGERQIPQRFPPAAATLVLMGLAALVVWLAERGERVADHSRVRIFSESLLLLLLSLLGAKLAFVVANALSGAFEVVPFASARSYEYAIPFATLAVVATLLLGRQTALVLTVLFSVLVSRLATDGDGLWVVFYSLAGSLGAVFSVDRFHFGHRLVVARIGMLVGGINLAMAIILAAVDPVEREAAQVGFDLLCAVAGGLLVTAATSFALPILEWLLGITTDIKLLELSNTNLPLLRRLAFEAPGTFQHSLMVANLAKEGCEAIGADPVLAYTSGLYHDVGKVLRPDYFVENQRPGHNRHDRLLPSMSALILIKHVKEGVELAREHALPRVLRDAIRQHHGTRLIKFFYTRALEQKDLDSTDVSEEKYRYPGPRPQNKVMGVLMLADAVEAASRTLAEPTTAKVRALIRTISDDILQDRQLDETDLTLADLTKVAEAFHRVLSNIFHQRIDYPGFDFNAVPRREKKGIRRVS